MYFIGPFWLNRNLISSCHRWPKDLQLILPVTRCPPNGKELPMAMCKTTTYKSPRVLMVWSKVPLNTTVSKGSIALSSLVVFTLPHLGHLLPTAAFGAKLMHASVDWCDGHADDLDASKAREKGTQQQIEGPPKRKKTQNLALLIDAGLLEEGAVLRYVKVQCRKDYPLVRH